MWLKQMSLVAHRALANSPLAEIPVRVRSGLAVGARWTAFPFSAYWRGHVEHDVEAVIEGKRAELTGKCCWDLGAHFGIYTIGMANVVGPSGQVAAFEPNPFAFEKCRKHVLMNALHQVRLFNCAASDMSGSGSLLISEGDLGSTSHFRYEDEAPDRHVRKITVQMQQIDALLDDGLIALPAFVKVDVEGHAAHALRGARRAIERALPMILVSFHSEAELRGTRELLEPLRYSVQRPDGTECSWEEALYHTVLLHRRP